MREKGNAIFTIVFLSSILVIFTLADLFSGTKLFSESENRLLAQKPELSMQTLFEGNYTADYEKYVTDQFVGRDKWIYLKTKTVSTLGRTVI